MYSHDRFRRVPTVLTAAHIMEALRSGSADLLAAKHITLLPFSSGDPFW